MISAIKNHLASTLASVEKPEPNMRGKVRDIFFKGDEIYLVVTDRISAFDQVLGTIPLKGALLTEQTVFWFDQTKAVCQSHYLDRLDPQIIVCQKATPLPIEVVVRGFLAGTLLREDKFSRGSSYGLKMDPNLRPYQKFEYPILTPTTKALVGEHDEPISAAAIVAKNLVAKNHWQEIEAIALELFKMASALAQKNGLLLVDTKYEFGLINGKIHLIDEVHTCDSSRFFMSDDYEKCFGQAQTPIMLDKEYFRQHLLKTGVDPLKVSLTNVHIDDDVKVEVAKRYYTLTEKITAQPFTPPNEGANARVHKALAQLFC